MPKIVVKKSASRKMTAITYDGKPSPVIPRTPTFLRHYGVLTKPKPFSYDGARKPSLMHRSGVLTNARVKSALTVDIPQLRLYLRIYRKSVSNLKNREEILSSVLSTYEIGPTIIWTETPDDLAIFTTAETYNNFIGFEAPFDNPRSSKYLTKILTSKSMYMKKGSILIKETSPENTTRILVHFCAYRIDENGTLYIFDPSWHSADPGIYSTTAFYDSLDAFGISYVHAEINRTHHWQSLIPFDDYCQTWTLRWLMDDLQSKDNGFPLPKTEKEARKQVFEYITEFTKILLSNMHVYMSNLPTYKLEGNDPMIVFTTIIERPNTILKIL